MVDETLVSRVGLPGLNQAAEDTSGRTHGGADGRTLARISPDGAADRAQYPTCNHHR